jgi:GTP cyclohydrolase I
MRFLLTLMVALALTVMWQSSVIAAVHANHACVAASDSKKTTEEKATSSEEDEEPDCD